MVSLVLKLQVERQRPRLCQNQLGAFRRTVADQAVAEPPPIAAPQDAAPEARPMAVFTATIAGIGRRWVGHGKAPSDYIRRSLDPIACPSLAGSEWALARKRGGLFEEHQLDAAIAGEEGIVRKHRVLVGDADHLGEAARAEAEAAKDSRRGKRPLGG